MNKSISQMTKEELKEKCYNQQTEIKRLKDKIKQLNKELEIKNICLSQKTIPNKIKIYMEETLAYIEEVERFKKKYESDK